MHSNFLLGNLNITENAKLCLQRIPYDLIARHAVNEHGNLSKREARRNEIAMKTIGEITSRYAVDPTNPKLGNVLIITQCTWDETLVKLESE
jgi:hypothetical protein